MRIIILLSVLLLIGCDDHHIISEDEWATIRYQNSLREKAQADSLYHDSLRKEAQLSDYYFKKSLYYWQVSMDHKLDGKIRRGRIYWDSFMLYKDSINQLRHAN